MTQHIPSRFFRQDLHGTGRGGPEPQGYFRSHIQHARALSEATGESLLAGLGVTALVLLAAWGWCWVMFA